RRDQPQRLLHARSARPAGRGRPGLPARGSVERARDRAGLRLRRRSRGAAGMSRLGWAAFAAMSAIWGVPYLFIKVAVDAGISPAFVSFARVAIAAAVLLALAGRAGVLGSVRAAWKWCP